MHQNVPLLQRACELCNVRNTKWLCCFSVQTSYCWCCCIVQCTHGMPNKIESLDQFSFFRGLKFSLLGYLNPLKNKWTFLELLGLWKCLIWAKSDAWKPPVFLEISGSWNISALLELSGSWIHQKMAFLRSLKTHLFGTSRQTKISKNR